MDNLHKKIKEQQSTFSKSFKKIASFLYSNPSVFAMNSAKEAGKQIGVSETTVIRFAHTLGYKGYSVLQQENRKSILEKSSLINFRDRKVSSHSQDDSIKKLMLKDVNTIQTLVEQISEDDLEQASTELLNAEKIYVAGVRASFSLASWFTFALDIAVGNARQYIANDDILIRISELNEKSVFVAFSFHRYGITTINLAELAKKQGATIIAITDNPYSPISKYSDITLAIHQEELSTLDLTPAVFSLLNSIISTITLRSPERFQQRVARFDAVQATDFFHRS
ncbi:MurR/RpiR family transcriptional regulator [Virgibacillus doumboii]|uniref:MurR/RpiR family transcriptional regulator n=1 Tax=Virgibacillus doumboii TaxID=2697503 RepID=UPI0013DF64C8|nr:MurR/RpiR family transcriptional regulator [Virgibacillus doumboii]